MNTPDGRNPSDAEIVARVLDDDREQYAVLVARHQTALYRHALGMVGSPDVAADLTQEAFVRGYSRLESCNDPARVGAWLFRILRNGCLDFLKSRRRETVQLEEDMAFAHELDGPETALERSELRRVMLHALAELPAPQREAFLLKHVDGHSYEEMADRLDVSVSALKMRVMRAREALQLLLSGRGVDRL